MTLFSPLPTYSWLFLAVCTNNDIANAVVDN